MVGTGVFYSAADYVQAQRVRRVGVKKLAELYQDVDLVLTPTSSAGAPTFAEMAEMMRGIGSRGSGGFGAVHTPYWDTAGNPVLTVPIGFTAGRMPLGMQLVGRPFDEALVLRAGDAFQQVTDWHLQVPPIAVDAGVTAASAA
jgi:aspartyl-tRNA(Asn)/glutamyl-tRNA(Gln) amidotransferase subunit A